MIHIEQLNTELLNLQAKLFQALSNPARLVVVVALGQSDLTVNELVEVLALLRCDCSNERTNISKHLAVLREAGVVSSTGDGQRRVYHLEARELLETVKSTESVVAGDLGLGSCCQR